MRVAIFVTCLGDTLFPEAGKASVTLLERLGQTVLFPEAQTCCGQMHANSGFADDAMRLVHGFVRTFDDPRIDAIVVPSGSCVAMIRHHYPRLAVQSGDRGLEGRISGIRSRVFELSEFVVDQLGVEDVGAYYPHRVVYHPSCHALRMLGVGDAPLRLLRKVRGIDLQSLPEADACCGFGGTFAVKNADVSAAMLTDKLRTILDTGAEVCTALDNSCLMHIGGGLERLRSGVRTAHLAEILAATDTP
ncbi:MAG TPA: (Fe-S)-binding protein [Solirubrobacteraceae bacterium]